MTSSAMTMYNSPRVANPIRVNSVNRALAVMLILLPAANAARHGSVPAS
ncbi:hypothetical protein ACT009_08370 [Sphingomonas sp. Tas61C01]